MNWDSNILCFLLLIVTFGVSNLSGNQDYNAEERSFNQHEQCRMGSKNESFELYHLQLGSRFNPTHQELVIIIGSNKEEGPSLANFITNYKQVPYTSYLNVSNEHDLTVQNHFLEFDDETENTTYYVHPGLNHKDDIFVHNFLAKSAIDYATKVKILLTCSSENCVPKLLEDAQKVIAGVLKYKSSIALVVTNGTLDSKEKKSFKPNIQTIYNELEGSSKKLDLAAALLETKEIVVVDSFTDLKLNEVRKLVKKLPFISNNKTDFKYIVSSSRRILATCICINQPLALLSNVRYLVVEIKQHYILQEKNINMTIFHEVLKFAKTVEEVYNYLSISYKELLNSNLTSSRPLFKKIREIAEHLNISFSANATSLLHSNERFYNFLYDMVLKVKFPYELWIFLLKYYLENDLLEPKRWYTSLREISDLDLRIIDVEKLQRLEDAMKMVENSHPYSENAVVEAEALKTVKLATFNRNVTRRCIGDKLEVRGDMVSLSYVKSSQCEENIKLIEVLALDKVLIDEDLKFVGQGVQVAIVAPIWEIIGNRSFDLSGEDGRKWEIPKAKSGSQNGSKLGVHGKPGTPGGPAGNFYGIAKTIVNGQQLVVSANGGNGGPGQDGGDGGKGEDGQSYDGEDFEYIFDVFYQNWHSDAIDGPPITRFNGNVNSQGRFEVHKYRRIYAKPGYPGGKGGDGGFGGRGGKNGDIKILELGQNSQSYINVSYLPGNVGPMGVGGKGGEGGSNGIDVLMHYRTDNDRIYNDRYGYISNGNASSGPNGQNGSYFLGMRVPKVIPVMQSFPRTVNNYKNFVREHIVDSVRNNKLEDFYTLLNNNIKITSSYSILDLIEEFIDLENQFSKLSDVRVLFPSYENLLERIEAYKKNLDQNENSDAYRALMNDMHSAIKEKVKRNKMHGDYPIKTAVRSEYNTLQTHYIKELTTAQTVERFTDMLKDSVKNFNADIDSGRNLLNTLQTAVEDVESNLDDDLNSLVAEVITVRESQKKKIDELKDQSKQIQKSIEDKILLGVSKAIVQALSLINPTLAAVGSAASSVLTVVENNGNNISTATAMSISIPKGLSLDFKAAEAILKLKNETMEKLIKEKEEIIKEAMKTLPEKDGKVLKRWNSLGDLEKEAKSSKPVRLTYRTIDSKFEAEKEELIEKSKKEGYKYTAAIKVFEKLQSVCEVAQTFGNISKNIAGDQELLTSIGDTITKANENLKELRDYEDNIYKELVPVLEGIKVNLNDRQEDFNNMSTIRLEAAKWNITSNLQTMKNIIVKMTQEYKSQDHFVWTLNMLTEAVTKLIDANAKIREIEEKKAENKFHVSLHINSLEEIPLTWYIGDSRISRSFSILKNKYLTNSLEGAYAEWIHVFKQYVFPNTEHLSQLPEVFTSSSDLIQLTTQIKKLDVVLSAYANHHLPENAKTGKFFHNSKKTSEPFHTWSRHQYSEKIANLLSGNRVDLFANISQHRKNYGVKFNQISITFYAENVDLLKELEEDLKYFSVTLTHRGDSYYRCGENIFLIKNSPTTITFGFDYEAHFTEDQYKEVTGKDYILSPYATWSIRLKKASPLKNFGDLEKYKNKVDLELVGEGLCIKDKLMQCDGKELSKYYKSI